jgi:hypothetical protein
MTTTLTRQQLVSHLFILCLLSFIATLSFLSGFADWLRSDPRYWAWFALLIIAAAALVFVFRRLLNSFQESPSGR